MPAHKVRASRTRKVDPSTFGTRLKEARIAAGLSPLAIAKRLRVGLSTYYSWESDDRRPRDPVGLAAVVRTSVGALYGERAA